MRVRCRDCGYLAVLPGVDPGDPIVALAEHEEVQVGGCCWRCGGAWVLRVGRGAAPGSHPWALWPRGRRALARLHTARRHGRIPA